MRGLALALAAAIGWLALPAHAQPAEKQPARATTAGLNWSRLAGAEGCPNVGELARRVGAHLKRDAFVSPATATLLIDASIRAAAPGFRVQIELSSSDQTTPGQRELSTPEPDCNVAVDSAALAIALMLDPDVLTRSAEPAPSVEARAQPTPEPTPPAPAPLAPPPTPVAAPRPIPAPPACEPRPRKLGPTRLMAGGLAAIDQVPGNSWGAWAGVRRTNQSRAFGVDLSVYYLAPRELEVRQDAGGEFSVLGGGISGVWSPFHPTPWAFSLLVGPQLGRISANGFGFASHRPASSWLVSGTVEVEAALAQSERWDLVLRLGLGVPFWHDTFEATLNDGIAVIWKPTPLFGTLKVALAFSP